MSDISNDACVGDLQVVCPCCYGVLNEVVSTRDIFGITVVTEHYLCRGCGADITAPPQSRRNKEATIAAREFAEKCLGETLLHRGYYRVEANGVCRELVDDEWPIDLCSQPNIMLDVCVHEVIVFARMEHAGCYVQVLGDGKARVLLDEPNEEVRYDEDGDFDV